LKQFSERIGRTSRLKSTTPAGASAAHSLTSGHIVAATVQKNPRLKLIEQRFRQRES
jgi:hypothetical protein